MDKLELDLNDLEVNSFQTNPEQSEAKGTVHGNITKDADRCESEIYTCYNTCDNTCDITCDVTCDGPSCRPECDETGALLCP